MATSVTTMALTGVLALGGAVAAQEGPRPPVEEAVAMAAPAFDWVRKDKLPGMGKLAGAGCPILMEDAAFTPSGTAIVLGADIFCGAAGANAWRSDDGAKWTQEKLDYTRPEHLGIGRGWYSSPRFT